MKKESATDIRAFQIYYNTQTRALLDAKFEPLDNSASERPDWYEYWPIRNYLSRNPLDESTYYGFLSPQFYEKTRLTGREVIEFIRKAEGPDVISFSPFPCHSACFLNVFEQGECFSPGLLSAAERFFGGRYAAAGLDTMVMDSRNTIFCNYFFAKPRFWKRWEKVLDEMFEQTEIAGAPLHSVLTNPLAYETSRQVTTVHAKVFVMERAASFILATSGAFTVGVFPPFELPLSNQFRAAKMSDLRALDALKISYAETKSRDVLKLYRELQRKTLSGISAGQRE